MIGTDGSAPWFVVGCFLAAVVCRLWHRQRDDAQRGELLRKALDRSPTAILLIEREGHVIFWSQSMVDLTGISRDQAMGCHLFDLAPFPPDQPIARMVRGIASQPLDQPLVFRTHLPVTGSQQPVPVMVNLAAMEGDSHGQPLIQLSLSDVTETDELQQRLRKALEEAEISIRKLSELDRLKSEFLAICGHELKTPLVSITGYLDLMSSERLGALTDKQRNALDVSLKNASRLNVLLSSLLDFARMEAGKMRFDFSPHKLETIIDEVVAMIHPMTERKHLQIVQELPEKLPYVLVDAGLMHRALTNILDNAMKFSQDSGKITIRCREMEDLVHIEVADTGTGCDPLLIKRLKEPFFQADTSDTRKAGGLGLGLAICDRILSGHGTTLEIAANEPQGTIIRFALIKAKRTASGRFVAFQGESVKRSPTLPQPRIILPDQHEEPTATP